MPRIHDTASGFDRAAEDYEHARPGYPPEAVALLADRLGLAGSPRVLDLGAGTGKLTRALVEQGAEVVAIEPVAGMREVLRRILPDVEVLDATAEQLSLPASSVDGVVAAQAFHWFDGPAALAEIARVLRPGGHLAVVFNRRDLASSVQHALDQLLAAHRGDTPSWASHGWSDALEDAPGFTAPELTSFPHLQRLDAAGFAARVASISFVSRLDQRTRGQVLAATRALFDQAQQEGAVVLRYVTEVRLLRRTGGSR